MEIVKDLYGEKVVVYDDVEEQTKAFRAYWDHDFEKLTTLEIRQFDRFMKDDPDGTKWEAAHAGVFAEDVDQLNFYGLAFSPKVGRNFKEGYQALLDIIGPHPISYYNAMVVCRYVNGLYSKEEARKLINGEDYV